MRFTSTIISALVVCTSLVSAAGPTNYKGVVELQLTGRGPLEGVTDVQPRYIHINQPVSELDNLRLLNDGRLINKRDPAWNDAKHDTYYSCLKNGFTSAGIACHFGGAGTAATAACAVGAACAAWAESAVKASKSHFAPSPGLPTTNTHQTVQAPAAHHAAPVAPARPPPTSNRPAGQPALKKAHTWRDVEPRYNVVLTFPEY